MSVSAKKEVLEFHVGKHGGIKYNFYKQKILDFSISVNPFRPSPRVRKVIKNISFTQYPDIKSTILRNKLSAFHNISADSILVTNGTAQAIWLIPLAYLNHEDIVLILAPTFEEYRVACQIQGAIIHFIWAFEGNQFNPNIDDIISNVSRYKPKLVWICNPNNPTGVYINKETVEKILQVCIETGSLLILDEAYINFVENPWPTISFIKTKHCIILRSMTKDFALTGLRLGYILADPDIIQIFEKVQYPWSVNIAAHSAGCSALDSIKYYKKTWIKCKTLTHSLRSNLINSGFNVISTSTNFMLINLKNIQNKDKLFQFLLDHNIYVRDCASFKLPEYIRIGTHCQKENRRLIKLFKMFYKNNFIRKE